jgi:hypothetical protein
VAATGFFDADSMDLSIIIHASVPAAAGGGSSSPVLIAHYAVSIASPAGEACAVGHDGFHALRARSSCRERRTLTTALQYPRPMRTATRRQCQCLRGCRVRPCQAEAGSRRSCYKIDCMNTTQIGT